MEFRWAVSEWNLLIRKLSGRRGEEMNSVRTLKRNLMRRPHGKRFCICRELSGKQPRLTHLFDVH